MSSQLFNNNQLLFLDDEDYFLRDLHESMDNLGIGKENIVITESVDDALSVIEKGRVKVFISDLKMGDLNGIDLLERIRQKDEEIILILFTGFAFSNDSNFTRRCIQSRIYVHSKVDGVANLMRNIFLYLNIGLEKGLSYENKLIKLVSENPNTLQVETPKIITDVRVINKSYYDLIKKNPKEIFNLTPREFEEYTAELFEKKGYKVKITPQTRDGGKDLLILEHGMLGEFMIYTECKKNSPHIPVGVRVVRELLGTITADRATAGIIVTSSYFSPDAIAFTEQIKNQMSLVDFAKLKDWMGPVL